ncbi:LamB/YcsF family protein [Alkalicoccus luteus]|uniref:5-oxoprolinase subunit A n=1 Tax=Alkalicoccus luteus TaxID=1237094 RepID=A0A969TXL4_9BACI|nr:5-oxoprolinase subunit PxpA [Alkalicoccus luteus]NJP38334.1 LamB/YcsF family protein [Alkalicoccus luteus]
MIDMNGDGGESFGAYELGNDEQLMRSITSINIACGFHAGDPQVMKRTVELAAATDTAIGAHPGFQDLAGFGRRMMAVSPEEIYALVLYQTGALQAFCRANGTHVRHLKPHGALYHHAAADEYAAEAVVRAAEAAGVHAIFAPPGSQLEKAAMAQGLTAVREAFADRRYEPDGTLRPRTKQGALLESAEEAAVQAEDIALRRQVTASDGRIIKLEVETICVHGDSRHAVETAQAIRYRLEQAGVNVTAPEAVV